MPKLRLDHAHWKSMYSIRKHADKKSSKKPLGVRDTYNDLIAWFKGRNDGMSILSCEAELAWYEAGNPYYKIWPQIASALGETNIEIDGKFLHLPFKSFEIRFPKHRDFAIREHDKAPAVTAMLVHKDEESNKPTKFKDAKKDDRDWSFMLHYQLESTLEADFMGYYFRFGVKNGRLLSEDFDIATKRTQVYNDGVYEPSPQFCQKLCKIAIATCFFGVNNHDMICPDIPYRLEERYHAAVRDKKESEAKKLLDQAKRLGHFGSRVGSELDLPRPLIKHINEAPGNQGKYELQYGFLRSGHMRLQRFGSKKNPQDEQNPERYELIFIAPHLVREDLPLRETRGYRIQDKILSQS